MCKRFLSLSKCFLPTLHNQRVSNWVFKVTQIIVKIWVKQVSWNFHAAFWDFPNFQNFLYLWSKHLCFWLCAKGNSFLWWPKEQKVQNKEDDARLWKFCPVRDYTLHQGRRRIFLCLCLLFSLTWHRTIMHLYAWHAHTDSMHFTCLYYPNKSMTSRNEKAFSSKTVC